MPNGYFFRNRSFPETGDTAETDSEAESKKQKAKSKK